MSTHDEIAVALTKLYMLFVKMGYLVESEVNWPPHDQKPLNIERLQEVGFDQSAIDLLQKIPWATTAYPLTPGFSIIVNYNADDDLASTRDPTNYYIDDPEDPQKLNGWMFPLNYTNPRSGMCFMVNAQEGTIQTANQNGVSPAAPAAVAINKLYNEYSALELIPIAEFGEILWQDESSLYPYAKKAMVEEYGWPDQFRTDHWRADMEELYNRWQDQIG